MAERTLPRENLVRAVLPGLELRDDSDGGMPTLTGHFARFNEWTEINSLWEGNFLERIAPGAFRKTIAESRDSMRVLFQHGQDPQIGDKPLGVIRELREDGDVGPYYEVPMFDTSYNKDLLPGLRAGAYGASFRFRVIREEMDTDPGVSDYNPKGLPERTLAEVGVREFGPVTFPAYAGATAGVRSLTDDFLLDKLLKSPEKLRTLLAARLDAEDLSCLGQMITLGTNYIAEQDEGDDAANVPKMESVLATLVELSQVEAAEDEPAEDEEYEAASSAPRVPRKRKTPLYGTKPRTETWRV